MSKRLIYAEDAIEALHDEIVRRRIDEDTNDDGALDEFDTEAIIKDLPSAQPQHEVRFNDDDHVWIDGKQYISLKRFGEAVKDAQPKRIKGRWKRKESDLSWWYECSECGESPLFDPYEHEVRTPFCPWCGAEMRKEAGGD